MVDCNEKWGSVRKVRYVDDIESAVQYALQHSNREFSKEAFASSLIQRRGERHNLIQKHYTREISRTKKAMYETHFSITLPDTLTFLKEIQVFAVKSGLVMPLQLTEEIKNVFDDNQKRALILRYVLNSKYKTYRCFLHHLAELEEFRIPGRFSKRDKRATCFVNENGFRTDIASFYTTRDLLYELDVVNWRMENDDLLIFFSGLNGTKNKHSQREFGATYDSILSYRKNFDDQLFLDELVDAYLNLTGRRFMRNADLIELRDNFCRKHHIGDFYFKELLLRVLAKSHESYRILLSFGTIGARRANYGLKLTSLPRLSSNRLALYISIEEEES